MDPTENHNFLSSNSCSTGTLTNNSNQPFQSCPHTNPKTGQPLVSYQPLISEISDLNQQSDYVDINVRQRTSSLCTVLQGASFPVRQELRLQPESVVYWQGTVERKHQGLLTSWQSRLLVLTNAKLYFFSDKSKTELVACINIKYLTISCKVQGCYIQICIEGGQQTIELKTVEEDEAVLWAEKINDVIDIHQNEQKVNIKKLNRSIYEQKDFVLEEEFLERVETGDILLVSSENSYAQMQKFFTNSDFNHVSLLYKYKDNVKVLEANEEDGVQIYDWSEYIRVFKDYRKLAWRRLIFAKKSHSEQSLKELAKKYIGNDYGISTGKLLKRKSNDDEIVGEKREFFCSELVAKIYKMIGLLDASISCSRYWPINFTSRGQLMLREGAHLGQEKTILLKKHLKL